MNLPKGFTPTGYAVAGEPIWMDPNETLRDELKEALATFEGTGLHFDAGARALEAQISGKEKAPYMMQVIAKGRLCEDDGIEVGDVVVLPPYGGTLTSFKYPSGEVAGVYMIHEDAILARYRK